MSNTFGDTPNNNSTVRQIELGEFGDHYGGLAKLLTAEQFAARFGTEVYHGPQDRVTVGGIDYYWRASTGMYDGWGRSM